MCLKVNFQIGTSSKTLIFAGKSVSWGKKNPFVARKCALKSWNVPYLSPPPGIWQVEIQTLAKIRSFSAKYLYQKFTKLV